MKRRAHTHRGLVIGAAIGLPVFIALGFMAPRILTQPARLAFKPFANQTWKRSNDQSDLETPLRNHVTSDTAWFLRDLPAMLHDPDPAMRFVAVHGMHWIEPFAPAAWPPGTQDALLQDPDVRVRDESFGVSLEIRSPPPDDTIVLAMLADTDTRNRSMTQHELAGWLGRDHLARLEYGMLTTLEDGPERQTLVHDLAWQTDGVRQEIAELFIADQDRKHRDRMVYLFGENAPWRPPAGTVPLLTAMLVEGEPAASQAATTLLMMDDWAINKPAYGGDPRPDPLPEDLRQRLRQPAEP